MDIVKNIKRDFQLKKGKSYRQDKSLTAAQKDVMDAMYNGADVLKIDSKKDGEYVWVSLYNENGNVDMYKIDKNGNICEMKHEEY